MDTHDRLLFFSFLVNCAIVILNTEIRESELSGDRKRLNNWFHFSREHYFFNFGNEIGNIRKSIKSFVVIFQ